MTTYLVLGPVSVLDERGVEVELGGAQRRALLAQLVLAPGRIVPSDALCAGLWGDELPPTATKSVQIHVSRLRQALPPGAIATRPPGYALEIPADATDLARFEAGVTLARRHREAGRVDRAAEELRAALALWRGPALADVADHPFAMGAAVRLEEARRQALEDRIDAELELGGHAALVAELEELVRADPLRERHWGQLMVALYRSGRQADALAAFGRARHHLVEELGIEPGHELRDIERAVLAQTVPPVAVARPRIPVAAVALHDDRPFVGRVAALHDLRQAFDLAATGRVVPVAVRGAEGLGKSALLAAFARSIGDARVVAGRCREHVRVPFDAWIDILRQLGADDAVGLLEAPAPALDDAPERRRALLFAQVVDRLRTSLDGGPLVIIIDDLHWSDEATVTLLLHVFDELRGTPMLVLLAWRDHEIGLDHPVTRLEHELLRLRGERFDVSPLDVGEIEELVRLGGEVDDADVHGVATSIHESTGGIALFAVDAVATMHASGQVQPPTLPATARTLVGRRLSKAGTTATAVADACAVLGERFGAREVSDLVPSLAMGDVVDALDRLVAADLLREDGGVHSFVHAVFRNAIGTAIPSGRRASLHAAAYRSMLGAGAAPAVLAHHAELAEPLVTAGEVVARLLGAADDAVARGAYQDAATLYHHVASRTRGADRARSLVSYASAMRLAGDIDTEKAVCAALITNTGEDVPDDVLAEAVVLHTRFGGGFAKDPVSLDCVTRALDRVTDPTAIARIRVAEAYHHAAWGSSTSVALQSAEAAMRTVPDDSPSVLRGEALHAESLALLGSPDLERRHRIADAMIDLGRDVSSWRDEGNGLRARSLVLMSEGRIDELHQTLDELLTVAERCGSWLYRTDVWRWRIAAAIARGDAASAMAGIEELEQLGSSPWAGRAFVVAQRTLLQWAMGDLDASLELLDRLVEALPDDPAASPDRRLIDLVRLVVLAEAGRLDEAVAGFEAWRPDTSLDDVSCRHHVVDLALVGRLACAAGDEGAARAVRDRLEPFRGQVVVMSWGEGILGAAERHLAELDALLNGVVDDDAFDRAAALEASGALEVEVMRTKAARERARRGVRSRP